MRFLAAALVVLASATPHLTMATSASATTVARGSTASLFVDIVPDPKVHVYAPGAKDYLPIALELAPPSGIAAEKLKYPKAQIAVFEPLKERVPVYDVPFRLVQDVKVSPSVKHGETLTITGTLKYQACDDLVCFNPVSAPVRWTLKVK
jgi:DsbC/DsbD-like thiol-disulfide interchange protein